MQQELKEKNEDVKEGKILRRGGRIHYGHGQEETKEEKQGSKC